MRLQEKNKRPIWIAYKIGENQGKMQFATPIKIYGDVGNMRGMSQVEEFGKEPEYDRVVHIELDSTTQYIDENTRIWIDIYPIDTTVMPDYQIMRKGDSINSIFTLFVNSLARNLNTLWYEIGTKIYAVKVDFNYSTLIAVIPETMYLPLTTESKIWYKNPNNNTAETIGSLTFVSKVKSYKNYIITFEVEVLT